MSEDTKKLAGVVGGTLVALVLAVLVGGWLIRGHAAPLMSYRDASMKAYPDPTIFRTVVGKGTPGLDLDGMLQSTPPAVARGKQLFGTYCAVCHGADGKGDGPAATGLKPPPRNFTSAAGWTSGYTMADIYTSVSEGVQGTAMGAFNVLSPADRFALVHYIQSLGSFDHRDDRAEDSRRIDARYHLSEGVHAPSKVAVPRIMKDEEADYVPPPAVRMPPAADAGEGAALCRRLVADPVRAAEVLSQVPDWRQNLDAFAHAAISGTPRNGFRSAVATLDSAQWRAFHDELVRRTPAPSHTGTGATKG